MARYHTKINVVEKCFSCSGAIEGKHHYQCNRCWNKKNKKNKKKEITNAYKDSFKAIRFQKVLPITENKIIPPVKTYKKLPNYYCSKCLKKKIIVEGIYANGQGSFLCEKCFKKLK